MSQTYLLLTGRPPADEKCLRYCMGNYINMLLRGAFKKIVCVTWKGCADSIKSVVGNLPNIDVLELDDNRGGAFDGTSFFAQMRVISAGLSYIPINSFVLKSRFDIIFEFDKMADSLAAFTGFMRPENNGVSDERIWIPYASLIEPFFLPDVVYFGRNRDLRKFINFDCYHHIVHGIPRLFPHLVEVSLWAPHIARSYGIFGELMSIRKYALNYYSQPGDESGVNQIIKWMDKEIFWEYIGSWLLFIYRHLVVGSPFYDGYVGICRHFEGDRVVGGNQRLVSVTADIEEAYSQRLFGYGRFLATDKMAWFDGLFGPDQSRQQGPFAQLLRQGARMLDGYAGGEERAKALCATLKDVVGENADDEFRAFVAGLAPAG